MRTSGLSSGRERIQMDKIVVIGGSGFVGSHTADELSHRGFKVVVFDNSESRWLSGSQEMVIGDVLLLLGFQLEDIYMAHYVIARA